MSAIEVILGGIILGGLYALVAIGFNLQYGMARIVNLAYGEFLMGAAFAAFWLFTLFSINPIVGMILSVPVTFVEPSPQRQRDKGANGRSGLPGPAHFS